MKWILNSQKWAQLNYVSLSTIFSSMTSIQNQNVISLINSIYKIMKMNILNILNKITYNNFSRLNMMTYYAIKIKVKNNINKMSKINNIERDRKMLGI